MKNIPLLSVFLVGLCLLFSSSAYSDEGSNTAITVYSKVGRSGISYSDSALFNALSVPGYGIIKESRKFTIGKKIDKINFTDVAAYIDPTTVMFKSKSFPDDTSILEQNYLFDLVSNNKLLEKYIDKKIKVIQMDGSNVYPVEGQLLSSNGGLLLKKDDGSVISVNNYSKIEFPSLSEGLITIPTLQWEVATNKTGVHDIEISYETKGISWWADYNVVYNDGADENSGLLDLGAWVTLVNKSGAGYKNAKLKLVAGDVQRSEPQSDMRMYKMAESVGIAAMNSGFQEKSFFEYHLYTLPRLVNVSDNSTKQLELFPNVNNIKAGKEYIYNGSGDQKVGVFLRFKNSKNNGLGMPMPGGRIRVSKLDTADNSLEFVGENTIDHTPKDEDILIKLGNAFDITGERKQVAYNQNNVERWAVESFEIKLKNHKDKQVNVDVKEGLYRYANWEIKESTVDYTKENSNTVKFSIKLPADSEKTIKYTVRYSW